MILVVASSTSELQGIEQFPRLERDVRVLPSGVPIVATAVGVGKVNAALGTIQALQHWTPLVVIGVGTCGAIRQDLQIGDIIFPSKIVQYDIDLRLFGWPRGSIPSATGDLEGALEIDVLTKSIDQWNGKNVWSSLVLGTADNFSVAQQRANQPWMREELSIDVVDMESYAMVKAAHHTGHKIMIARVVSDTWRGNRPKGYQRFLAESSADLFSLLAQYTEPSEKSPTIL